MRVGVVVPAFNEAPLVGLTLQSMPGFVDYIVVVDDGSTDATGAVARSIADARIHVCAHRRNAGVGSALRTGFRKALALGADAVAVMAGDAQMDPHDLASMLAPLLEGADFVQGDRLSHPSVMQAMPVGRWAGNHVLSWLTQVVTGLPVRDAQCGYMAMSRAGARLLQLDRLWPGYGYPNDLLSRVSAAKLAFAQVTVRPVYGAERSGIRLRHMVTLYPAVLMVGAWRRIAGTRPIDLMTLIRCVSDS